MVKKESNFKIFGKYFSALQKDCVMENRERKSKKKKLLQDPHLFLFYSL
jgi:hypothetical protein